MKPFSQKFYRILGIVVVVILVLFFMSLQDTAQVTRVEDCLRKNPTYTVDACRVLTKSK